MSTTGRRGDDIEPTFGGGGDEPYASALRSDGMLILRADDRPDDVEEFDVGRWSAAADEVDLALFSDVDGPVIDLGCGPGRMLVAARSLGLPALGVDLSAEAVRVARQSGMDVLLGSVFDAVPDEGHWDTAFLIDGNIGIGGDPARLLARSREIVREGGSVIVETNPDHGADRRFFATVTDHDGRSSARFPWAATGQGPLADYATAAGFRVHSAWATGTRSFTRLVSR
ncbi:class I SAM-dependent methyltransferase [Frondihabitans australicus]|uniref:Methyltransferase family protein n=1 Tax=Frondihabitans australicus TaxID=386892 RepID=A0A495ICY3_9MICO|nr:methyltransferase domain-containing protein [Frondihabitans australicus]RKR73318.1 methyltransferase family protein [Frondihabitans australicus]